MGLILQKPICAVELQLPRDRSQLGFKKLAPVVRVRKIMYRIFLFGEAEKGQFCTPHPINQLPQLLETLGHPPVDSQGIHYAVQALLFQRELIFFRVEQEGFSIEDYQRGMKLLSREGASMKLTAICLPGVGDREILDPMTPLCLKLGSLLIIREGDLFDYLTSK